MTVPLWAMILIHIVLILIIAYISAAEASLSSLSEKKLEKLAEDDGKTAKKILKLLDDPDRFYRSVTAATVFFGFLSSAFAAEYYGGALSDRIYSLGSDVIGKKPLDAVCTVLVTLVLTYLTMVFGILVPKSLSSRKPEKTAKNVYGIAMFFTSLTKPLSALTEITAKGVLKLFKVDPGLLDEEVTEEEIRQMVDAGEEDGNIESNEKEMIENVFEFNNILASDVMVHRTEMEAIDVEQTPDEIFELINETGFSRFPVYEDNVDKVIGILSSRKFLIDRCSDRPKPVRELLYEPYFVPETVKADALFRDMQKKKAHIAIVLDEYGGTSGLITLEDLIEQIVGNIYDETDDETEERDIEKIGDNLWRMQGSTELELIEEELGIDFPEEDDELSTLSGLIFSRFTTIPSDGETPELDVDRLHIKVEEITEHRVVSALVELIPEPEDEEDGDED